MTKFVSMYSYKDIKLISRVFVHMVEEPFVSSEVKRETFG